MVNHDYNINIMRMVNFCAFVTCTAHAKPQSSVVNNLDQWDHSTHWESAPAFLFLSAHVDLGFMTYRIAGIFVGV